MKNKRKYNPLIEKLMDTCQEIIKALPEEDIKRVLPKARALMKELIKIELRKNKSQTQEQN